MVQANKQDDTQPKALGNWHEGEEDDDDYDDEEGVVFGEDNSGAKSTANNSAAASKTTQSSSGGKNLPPSQEPRDTAEPSNNEEQFNHGGQDRGGFNDRGDRQNRGGPRNYEDRGPRNYDDRGPRNYEDRRGGRDKQYGGGGRDYGDRRGGNYGDDRGFGGDRDRRQRGYNDKYNRDEGQGGDNFGRRDGGYGGDNFGRRDGGYGGGRGGHRDQGRPHLFDKFSKDQINPNSNYRLYYQNDPEFFSMVIDQETTPFHFKIHLFQSSSETEHFDKREDRLLMQEFLANFGAEEVHMQPITDHSGRGNSKLRIFFILREQEQAKALYDMVGVNKVNMLPQTDMKMQIYFLLPEAEFEKYGDESAAKFYEDETKRKEEQQLARKNRADKAPRDDGAGFDRGQFRADKRDGGNRDGGNRGGDRRRNDRRHNNEQETGIKFSQGPPKFTNSKPKDLTAATETEQEASHRQVTYNQSMAAPAKKPMPEGQQPRNDKDEIKVQGQGEQKDPAQATGAEDGAAEEDGAAQKGGRKKGDRRNDRRKGEGRGGNREPPVNHEEEKLAWTKSEKPSAELKKHEGGRGGGRHNQRKRYNTDDHEDGTGEKHEAAQNNQGDDENAGPRNERGARRGNRRGGRGGRGGHEDGDRGQQEHVEPQDQTGNNNQERGRGRRRGGEDRGGKQGRGGRGGRGQRADNEARGETDGQNRGGRNEERANVVYKNKGRRPDGAAAGQQDPRIQKQVSNVSEASIKSTNRFSALQSQE